MLALIMFPFYSAPGGRDEVSAMSEKLIHQVNRQIADALAARKQHCYAFFLYSH